MKDQHPAATKEGHLLGNPARGAPQRTTCTLEMETTSGLVLRGVVSNMEEGEGVEPRTLQGCRGEGCEYQTVANSGMDAMNVYVFNDTKSHDALEQYSPESDRKVMII